MGRKRDRQTETERENDSEPESGFSGFSFLLIMQLNVAL